MSNPYYSGLSTFFVGLALAPSLMADADKASGTLTVDRSLVLANAVVNVNWSANYPTKPAIPDKTTLVTTEEVRAEVRVVGASFGPPSKPYPVQGWVKTSTSSDWTSIFLGNCNTVNPDTIVWSKTMAEGEKLDFKFQGSYDQTYDLNKPSTIGSWQQAIDTTTSSVRPWNRMVFVDGQTPPNLTGALGQKPVHDHLTAYFEPGTKRLKLAENDFIYLTELSPFAQGNKDTDMQDLVLVVKFIPVKTVTEVPAGNSNNGHGNNLDGVDSSNPGQGGGGPTGLNNSGLDPSAGVDDEGKPAKKK